VRIGNLREPEIFLLVTRWVSLIFVRKDLLFELLLTPECWEIKTSFVSITSRFSVKCGWEIKLYVTTGRLYLL
jgi:hypothetical protein